MANKNQIVIDRLLARKNGKKDKQKIGLIIQGGGLRSAFAGGVLTALEEQGYSDCFDVVYGSSAGSCIGAYFLSKQAKIGQRIYWENLVGNKFVRPFHPLRKMNLDYLLQLMKNEKEIDLKKVKASKSILKVCVTERDSGKLKFFTNKDNINLFDAIKASCAYPGFYYPVPRINGQAFLDGDSHKLLPLEEAVKDGCTDILIVATVPEDYQKNYSKIFNLVHFILTLPLGKNFQLAFKKRKADYNNRLDYIFGRKKFAQNVNFYTIHPDYNIKNSERNSAIIKDFVKHGEKRALETFSR